MALTPAQRDQSNAQSYWLHAAEYGLQYYIAGRYATHALMIPVCGNLLHHAIELLIKSTLAYGKAWADIQEFAKRPPRGYSHDLEALWAAFKARPESDATFLWAFDDLISDLHHWEDVRYPETLVMGGGLFNVSSIHDLQPHEMSRSVQPDGPRNPALPPWQPPEYFTLVLPKVDRLVRVLIAATQVNPDFLRQRVDLNKNLGEYLWLHNATPPFEARAK